jgi:hypothetical protein
MYYKGWRGGSVVCKSFLLLRPMMMMMGRSFDFLFSHFPLSPKREGREGGGWRRVSVCRCRPIRFVGL